MEIVPAMVAKKRNAAIEKPLLSGEIVFKIIVIAGLIQHSAKRYSNASIEAENQKLSWQSVAKPIKGIPKAALNMQMLALAFKNPFFSSLSEMNPPLKHEARPNPATMNALAMLY